MEESSLYLINKLKKERQLKLEEYRQLIEGYSPHTAEYDTGRLDL